MDGIIPVPTCMHQKPLVIVVVLVLGGVIVWGALQGNDDTSSDAVALTSAGSGAFGSLADVSVENTTRSKVSEDDSLAAEPTIAPWGGSVRYTYTGDPLTLDASTRTVYERQRLTETSFRSDAVSSEGIIDLSSFTAPELQSISLQSGDYLLDINLVDGTASLTGTSTSTGTARDLTDDAVVAIADTFLADHGISTAPYGTPTVTRSDDVYPLRGETATVGDDVVSSEPFAPISTVSLTYPLMVDGMEVVYDGGYPVSLEVSVDTVSGTVASVYGIIRHAYTTSQYNAVTDADSIIDRAESGGWYAYDTGTDDTATIIELGTPDRVLLSTTLWDDDTYREILVPALRFSADDPSGLGSSAVIVPLISEVFHQRGDTLLPMPFEDSGSEEGSSGSAGAAVPVDVVAPDEAITD